MTHRIISIPGESTRYENCPRIAITGGGNTSLSVSVTYSAAPRPHADAPRTLGEVVFSGVLEFRWIDADASYEEYPQHEDAFEFGLIEILDSAYIETMVSRGSGRDQPPGHRISGIPEASVRHFRMGFDDWGELNVIATELSVRALVE
jgi:hypothetical protein